MASLDILRGRRILVVEDEPLVSMMMEDVLCEAGCYVVGPAGTVEEAFELLDRASVQGAVLDIKLMNGTSRTIVAALAARGIPFVVVTGIDQKLVPADYDGAPVVEKVFAPHELIDAVADILSP